MIYKELNHDDDDIILNNDDTFNCKPEQELNLSYSQLCYKLI